MQWFPFAISALLLLKNESTSKIWPSTANCKLFRKTYSMDHAMVRSSSDHPSSWRNFLKYITLKVVTETMRFLVTNHDKDHIETESGVCYRFLKLLLKLFWGDVRSFPQFYLTNMIINFTIWLLRLLTDFISQLWISWQAITMKLLIRVFLKHIFRFQLFFYETIFTCIVKIL